MCKLDFSDYGEVFRPASPLKYKKLFIGREQESKDLSRCLNRRGFHPIVIGNRGVGKTTLVKQVLNNRDIIKIKINCNSRMTWENFSAALLKELGNDTDKFGNSQEIGFSVNPSTKFFKHDKKTVIIMDEYEKIHSDNKAFHTGVVDLMKTLSDNSDECDSRLIIVGIAQSAKDLLGGHESIERSAREIYLHPLRNEDICDFINQAEELLQFSFAAQVKRNFISGSLGYPYFVHLVGLGAIDAMIDRKAEKRIVTIEDYKLGLKKAVKQAFQSEFRKYRELMNGLSNKEEILLKELCLYDDPNSVKRKDLQQYLVNKNKLTENEFESICIVLQQEKKILYVSRTNDIIRFADPLMAPFLKAFYDGQ